MFYSYREFFLIFYYSFYYLIIFPLIQYNPVKLFENKFKQDGTIIIYFNRLLAKHALHEELKTSRLRENSIDSGINKKMKHNPDVISTYANIKKVKENDLDAYKKGYNKRHSKRKGLRKLECYCEKKVFDKFDYIYNTAKDTNSIRSFSKKIFNNFAFRFIVFVSLPVLGFIIPLLFRKGTVITENWCFSGCTSRHDKNDVGAAHNVNEGGRYITSMDKDTWSIINAVNFAFLYLSLIILILVVIYILLKFIK